MAANPTRFGRARVTASTAIVRTIRMQGANRRRDANQRMKEEHNSHVKRHPRQIEQGTGATTAKKATQLFEVAKGRIVPALPLPGSRANRHKRGPTTHH